MSRKWKTLASAVAAVTLLAAGLALAADEDTPIKKVMEQVSAKNNAIKKATRTLVAYKKGHADLAKHAEELIDLGKKSREMKDSSEKQKKPFADWQKLSDDFIAKTEVYKEAVATTSPDQKDLDRVKKAFAPVAASCTACHEVFRKEDE